jgi:hypothetical protein
MTELNISLRPDSKGRITLGKLADGVSSFRARQLEDGSIVLEPFAEIPAREHWLFNNTDALASVKRGISDSAAGRVVSRGNFSKHLKD